MNRGAIGTVAIIAVVATLLATYATLNSTSTFHNTTGVNAVGVGVYSNIGCTTPITTLSWGMLDPGAVSNNTVYVLNNGTESMNLTMATGNWNPSAAQGNFTVPWNQQNTALAANSNVTAVITLNVSSSAVAISSVTFDITITGTGN